MEIQASLAGDDDGFLSRECPTCSGRFKASIRDGSIVVRYCPYCGHEGAACWWTPEQLEYMRAIAVGAIQPDLDAAFAKLPKLGGFISITVEQSTPEPPVMPAEQIGSEVRYRCGACLAEVKLETPRLRAISGGYAPFTCIECGSSQPWSERNT
jgi:hypothetical protein